LALSDSELLALVEKAQEARKGDKGEQGIGIESVNSPEPGKLVIVLTDGTVNNFVFPSLKGETGDRGLKGEAGNTGTPGPMGPKGPSGVDGKDGVSVDSALVSGGSLLIGLSDGRAIDAGRVVGPVGATGPAGQDGVGKPGLDGRDGRDGATILTGIGKPELEQGKAGDLFLDVASENLTLYKRTESAWLLLAELRPAVEVKRRQHAMSGGVSGGGGAAGGGGAIIIHPGGDPAVPPIVDNDGVPVDNGDMWYDPDSGFIYIRHQNQWVLVAGYGPAFVSPTPPTEDPGEHPIVEGDLWFDSVQLALYVAAKDELDDMRWVISIPADRSVLQDVVTPDNPFRFPSPKVGGGDPWDGMTVYNPTTKLWYVFNAGKNQWIDLPPGVNELSMQAILVRGADGFDETFEYEQADRDRLGTDALCYVNADDHDAFTRIVIPDFDTAGFDWSFLIRAIRPGDQLTLIQSDIGDPADPDDDFPFRSDYLTVGEVVENLETFNTEIAFESENPVHVPLFDEPVAIRFKAIVNVGEGEIYYQEIAPDPVTDPELTPGNIWIDSDDNKLYVWNGHAWSEVTACNGDTDVTKEYVDAQDDKLQQEIIKLQEEISAIAPSTDVGVWKDGATPNPSEGQFVMRLPGGAVTQQYSDPTTDKIIIHKTDSRGAKYNFEDVKVGQLIQLFDVIDQNFGTYVIDAIDNADATFIALDVTWRQGLGGTHVDDDVIVRIFDSPTGGTASEFVLRSGDDMTGTIEIDDPAKITKANELINKGYVDEKFLASGVPDYLQPYWKKGATIVNFASNGSYKIKGQAGAKLYKDGVVIRVFSGDENLTASAGPTNEFAYVIPREDEWHRLDNLFKDNGTAVITLLQYCQTERVGNFSEMFKSNVNFVGTGLEYLRYDSAETLYAMFINCSSLNKTLDINLPVATSTQSMFQNCSSLNTAISLYAPNVDTAKSMFSGCTALTGASIRLPGFKPTSTVQMFDGCTSLTGNSAMLDWDMSCVYEATSMFRNCTKLTRDVSSWDLSSLYIGKEMFYNCQSLEADFSSWDLRRNKNFTNMFRMCYKLQGDYTHWGDWMCLADEVGYMFYASTNVEGDVSGWVLPFCNQTANFNSGTKMTGQPNYGQNSDGTLNSSCPPSTNFKNLGLHLHGTLRTVNTTLQVGNALKPDGTRIRQVPGLTTNSTNRHYAEVRPGEEFYQLNSSTVQGFRGAPNVIHEPGDHVEWHADSDTSEHRSLNYFIYHRHPNSGDLYDTLWVLPGLGQVIDTSNITHFNYHLNFSFDNAGMGVDLGYTQDIEYDLSNYDLTNVRYAGYVFASSVKQDGEVGPYKLINFNQMKTPQTHRCNTGTYSFFPPRWNDPQYGFIWDPKELEGMDWSKLNKARNMFTGPNDEDVDITAIGLDLLSFYTLFYLVSGDWIKNVGDLDTSSVRYFRHVFTRCDFDPDLSQWCVRTYSTHTEFESDPVVPISRNHLPDWGYCPRNEDDLDKYIH
jgi:surface protein